MAITGARRNARLGSAQLQSLRPIWKIKEWNLGSHLNSYQVDLTHAQIKILKSIIETEFP